MQFYQSYNDSTNYLLGKSFTWAEFPHYFQKKVQKRELYFRNEILKNSHTFVIELLFLLQ